MCLLIYFVVVLLFLCCWLFVYVVFFFFFFKQKTAYEMRISDWSSDVCSSDLESAAISVGIELSLWSIWFADHRDLSDISQIDQGATFIWKCTDSVHSPALVSYLH